ncbi:MAG: sulfite exporter TauE/SafE family protein [Halobacteriovoraceae bacterium]|nr:sulfite exporter TauE/SafE family protein [Halobacteriovoraceae bacterium]
MEFTQIGILTFLSGLTATISATIGMAGGIVLLSLMTFFFSYQNLVPVHGIVQLVSNSTRSFILREHIILPIFYWTLLGLPLGTVVAVYLIKQIDQTEYFLGLIVLLIFYVLFKPKKMPHLQIPFWGYAFVGFFTGLLGPLIGATGPMQAVFFLRDDFSKENIVATKASSQFIGHLFKIPAFLYLQFDYFSYLPLIVFMSVGTIIGTKIGVSILGKINERVFTIIYKSALFIAALRIIYRIFKMYI